ncbi:MAG: YdeI/OmpD-associated family protein [Opitutaceae bacterium]
MSRNLDPRIDAYIENSAPFARPILKHLRALVHQGCPAATETIKWSMPHFEHPGAILCGFAGFKTHCTFHFWHQRMEKMIAAESGGRENAMGNFGRITSLDDLPDDKTMLRYINEAAKLNESGIPGRSRPAPGGAKPELAVPADLTAALKKNKTAAKTFTGFSVSHRKEYITWITEARREETRRSRLATTIEWLSEGKSRYWKYINC